MDDKRDGMKRSCFTSFEAFFFFFLKDPRVETEIIFGMCGAAAGRMTGGQGSLMSLLDHQYGGLTTQV